MKKLLLCSVVAAFACVSAVQAGDNAKPCADSAKACTAQAKACSDSAKACADKAKATDCSACCSKKAITKKADSTAKGASQLIAKR